MKNLIHACGHNTTQRYNGEDDVAEFLIDIETSLCAECQKQADAQEEQELEKLLDAYEKSMREADERREAFCNACNYDAESPQWNCNKCIETQDKYVPLITPRKEITIRRDVYYECQCCGAKHMTDTLCCGYTACEKVVVEQEYELCHKCGGDTMWDIPCVCDDLAEADLSRLVLGLPSMEVIKDDDDGRALQGLLNKLRHPRLVPHRGQRPVGCQQAVKWRRRGLRRSAPARSSLACLATRSA